VAAAAGTERPEAAVTAIAAAAVILEKLFIIVLPPFRLINDSGRS
jgi:hypothetical protein